jgi:hypothetical protein
MVADLLAVIDVCIEASKARARLLESRGKGSSKKKQDDREVNMTDHGDPRDRGNRGNRQQEPAKQEGRSFRHPADAEKWCEIYHTDGHDLEWCKTFLDHKKMSSPAPVA